MGTVSLIATQAYPYAGRSLQPGDAFEASEKDAEILKKIGRAKDAPQRLYQTKVLQPPAPDASQDVASPSKRRYRRRDLVAEP